jgi:hypothetical protein
MDNQVNKDVILAYILPIKPATLGILAFNLESTVGHGFLLILVALVCSRTYAYMHSRMRLMSNRLLPERSVKVSE